MKNLPQVTATDRIDAAVRAGASAAVGAMLGLPPGITEAAMAYAMGFIASPLQRRRDAWFVELASALKELQRRLGKLEDLENNDAFLDVVFAVIPVAIRTGSEKKRRALRNAIVNSGLPGAPATARQHLFVQWVDDLSDLQVSLMGLFDNPTEWFKQLGRKVPTYAERANLSGSPADDWQVWMTLAFEDYETDESFYRTLLADLAQRGLLTWVGPRPAEYGNLPEEGESDAPLTSLGREFLRFIQTPAESVARAE